MNLQLLWLHGQQHENSTSREVDDTKNASWWIGFKPSWQVKYVTYEPYKLVTADVFGVHSRIPADVASHLSTVFAEGWQGDRGSVETLEGINVVGCRGEVIAF